MLKPLKPLHTSRKCITFAVGIQDSGRGVRRTGIKKPAPHEQAMRILNKNNEK